MLVSWNSIISAFLSRFFKLKLHVILSSKSELQNDWNGMDYTAL